MNKCMERYVVYHRKRELKGHMCLCEKNLAMECDREKKSNMFNWHEKKTCTKKLLNPPLKNLMVCP